MLAQRLGRLLGLCGLLLAAACGHDQNETETSTGAALSGGPQTVLISDIDDTIKRTDVLDKVEAAINGVQSRNAFAGMSMLYTDWRNEDPSSHKVTYLSAAPGALVLAGMRFLQNSNFPGNGGDVTEAVVSGRKLSESAGDFKSAKLYAMYDAQVASNTVPKTFILIGDNGEQDMIAYRNFIDYVAQKGGSTDGIYSFIHHVYDTPQGSEIVAPHRPFVTAADLAVQLRNLSLINDTSLSGVLTEVATQLGQAQETVIPSFMRCSQLPAWPPLDPTSKDYTTVETTTGTLCGAPSASTPTSDETTTD
jgi:hypothetical protein